MAANLFNTGEEWILDLVPSSGVTFFIGLYNDSTDSLTDADDIGAITTEPDTANSYARQTEQASNVTVDTSGSDAALDFPTQTFDVSTNSETVDFYFVGLNFDSDKAGDGGTASDHLIQNGPLSQSRDLSQIETLDVDNIGGTQD